MDADVITFRPVSVVEPPPAALELRVAGILGALGYLFPAIHTQATFAAEPDRYDRFGVKREAALRHIEAAEARLRDLREALAVAEPGDAA